jgi:hypothetical protein
MVRSQDPIVGMHSLDGMDTFTSTTLATSVLKAMQTSYPARPQQIGKQSWMGLNDPDGSGGSTGKGILIGMLSAFGSAGLVALLFAIIYFFRFTSSGRIFLDRMGRPGEYDDEQAIAREEEAALEEMDDIQRAEYLRAKGKRFVRFWR